MDSRLRENDAGQQLSPDSPGIRGSCSICVSGLYESLGGSGKAEGLAGGGWADHRQAALAAATQTVTMSAAMCMKGMWT
jgi:hypothetical protein